jgi:hypothetical protein
VVVVVGVVVGDEVAVDDGVVVVVGVVVGEEVALVVGEVVGVVISQETNGPYLKLSVI